MHINRAGLDLIKEFEGFRPKAYVCPAGVWTCGFGTTRGVKAGMVWTKEQAERALMRDVRAFESAVLEGLDGAKVTDTQFSAMVALCYNIGATNFAKSSVLRFHKAGSYDKAADSFRLWNKANGQVLNGLIRRREAERNLYLTQGHVDVSNTEEAIHG